MTWYGGQVPGPLHRGRGFESRTIPTNILCLSSSCVDLIYQIVNSFCCSTSKNLLFDHTNHYILTRKSYYYFRFVDNFGSLQGTTSHCDYGCRKGTFSFDLQGLEVSFKFDLLLSSATQLGYVSQRGSVSYLLFNKYNFPNTISVVADAVEALWTVMVCAVENFVSPCCMNHFKCFHWLKMLKLKMTAPEVVRLTLGRSLLIGGESCNHLQLKTVCCATK